MFPKNGERLLDLCKFTKCTGVVDIVYNPAMTGLLLDAERLGIKYSDGLPMLVAQAKRACEIFKSEMLPDRIVEEILGKLRMQMMNITLVGMPGCGKTTVGNILAERLGRELYDTDAEICKSGRTPSDIITDNGEESFRRIEHETVEEIGKLSGKIIATGGGVVKNYNNYFLLKRNGKIFNLSRLIEKLCMKGRPLSKDIETVKKLYSERKELYNQFADFTIYNNGEVDSAVKGVLENL
jgi:shikimate dehydrogenase